MAPSTAVARCYLRSRFNGCLVKWHDTRFGCGRSRVQFSEQPFCIWQTASDTRLLIVPGQGRLPTTFGLHRVLAANLAWQIYPSGDIKPESLSGSETMTHVCNTGGTPTTTAEGHTGCSGTIAKRPASLATRLLHACVRDTPP